ncbi:M1 family metallopeptidase [Paucilactobacillus sp. N302-9]
MKENIRLYQKFQPNHYQLFFDIDRKTKQIKGKTIIDGEAKTNNFALHQKYLQINSIIINNQNVKYLVDDQAEVINIEANQTGQIRIEINYQAPLTDTMMGIYPSYYEVDGIQKQIIGTQFETTAARQAFPSIDEPEAKATFDIAIKFDEHPDEIVLSNMPEQRVEQGVHYFETTVRMSTYLVAFAFGELQSKETVTKSGVKVGVFSTKAHQPKELDFALDIAKRSIEFYEDFYQTTYPLPHSWQLALPDFSAGAMENWGLVTYREAYLLLDPDNTAFETKQLVATVIAHELAHQWFGDLVTMKWWDDLWLNESFANMMEYVAIDAIEPDWHIWELFQTSEAPMALQRDATDGVQSVHVQVENPAEIDSIFDGAIVYAKGARMLVMVRGLIGDVALQKGLKQYFAAHQYANATGADLWQALGEASGINLSAIMDSWLEQPGYPVVTAAVMNGKLTLTQQQFFIGDGVNRDRLWKIPLNSNYQAAPNLFEDKKVVIGDYDQLRQQNGVPFRLNVDNESHFIVSYDDQLLNDILAENNELDAIAQLQILQDLRLLAQAKQVSYADVVPLLPNFAKSHFSIVNTALYRIANDLKQFVHPDTPEEQQLQQVFNQLSHDSVERLGWQPIRDESNDNQLTRPIVLNAALYAQNTETIDAAHQLFIEHQKNLQQLPADLASLILSNEVERFGTDQLFDELIHSYQTTSDASLKASIAVALPKTKAPELIKKLINLFENTTVIKPQDLRAWYRGLLANQHGQQAAWNWIRDEWSWLEKTVGGDMEFATFITVTAGIFHTRERLDEFKNFFEPKIQTPGLTREIKMDTKIIESKVNLIEAEKLKVNQAIKQVVK